MTHKLLILMTALVLAGCAGKTRTNNTQSTESPIAESFAVGEYEHKNIAYNMEDKKMINQDLNNEPREDVRELIESLREKLEISQSIEEIATDWNGGEPVTPQYSSSTATDADKREAANSFIDNWGQKSNFELDYPWRDVLASMYAYPDSVVLSDRKCHCCGSKIVRLHFVSCRSSWQHLCGRAGSMVICPSCVKQIAVRITVLN